MLPIAATAECVVRSGSSTAALVELYTSEGCSSCPPADRWLSRIGALPASKVVPIAFHVTYWDYIGWRDAFASERHTARQRERASAAGARYVYTPQVVVGGRDFREWHRQGAFELAVEKINATPARAQIELRVRPEGGKLHVDAGASLQPGVAARNLALVVAATQSALSSRVTAGENKGEHLRHDFVVRDFVESRTSMKASATLAHRDAAVVAFVQDLETGAILQAVSAPPCR